MSQIQIEKCLKGNVITVHSAIEATATSDPVDCRGYNALLVYFDTSAANNWTIKVQGAPSRNGTYADVYELANTGSMAAMSYQLNADRVFIFKGIPDWVKVVATEDVNGATVTVKVQPCIV